MRTAILGPSCVALIALLASSSPAAAQGNEPQCRAILASDFPGLLKDPNNTSGFCNLLAGQIYTDRTKVAVDKVLATGALRVGDVFSQRDLQNRRSQQASPGGTPAQGEAIPSVQPAGVAAGTIAALGTRAGQDAIAALSLNPAVLFLGSEINRGLAKASRVADVTVYIPVSGVTNTSSTTTDPNKLRYVGARLRLNFLGISSGSDVWQKAETMLKEQIVQGALFQAQLAKVLGGVPDVRKCVAALAPDAPAAAPGATASCDTLDLAWNLDEGLSAKLHDELAAIRRQADSKYLGADIRYDFGDPTLGDVENASGQFLFAGVSAGRRFDDGRTRTSAGVRGRLGIRHAKLDSEEKAEYAAEGGVGIEVARRLDEEDEVNISGAVEFRWGGAPANLTDRFQTDFTMLRGSISLPVTRGNSISINVGKPIRGDVSPIFSVNFNWGLLLSQQLGR